MNRLHDFRCENNHVWEHLVPDDVTERGCPSCSSLSHRLISPVSLRAALSSDAWAKMHEKDAKVNSETKGIAHI